MRAEKNMQYPADVQLIMTANPCLCGNRDERVCYCSAREVQYYWKRLGNALLDRIDIRVPVKPVTVEQITGEKGETSKEIRKRVSSVIQIQAERFVDFNFRWNAHISPGLIDKFCYLDMECAYSSRSNREVLLSEYRMRVCSRKGNKAALTFFKGLSFDY